TRVMYWNIENFAFNKIYNPKKKGQKGASISAWQAARDRLLYIRRHLTELDPDIFIIVEVETAYNDSRGKLATGAGALGLVALYAALKKDNRNLALVPPLITGPTESVGVFYKRNKVQFTGPNLWNGAAGYDPILQVNAAQNYIDQWRLKLPDRTVANNSAYNPGASERQCAARIQFAAA